MDPDGIVRMVERHTGKLGGLLAVLEHIQETYGYLPRDALSLVAERMSYSLVDVYGVARFYRSFRLDPRGKHVIWVCLGTACHVRGAPAVVEEFERQLEIKAGETTGDGEFTLETINCLGACALGPIVVVDGRYFARAGPAEARQIIEQVRAEPCHLEPDGDHVPRQVEPHAGAHPPRPPSVPVPPSDVVP
ncbi:MAG: NAD(P)H-dependent oxidoreductase subunit E [Candidatus Brocadiaceae bacterium]|jgi:NADH-quinone oxidoreductase subunit E